MSLTTVIVAVAALAAFGAVPVATPRRVSAAKSKRTMRVRPHPRSRRRCWHVAAAPAVPATERRVAGDRFVKPGRSGGLDGRHPGTGGIVAGSRRRNGGSAAADGRGRAEPGPASTSKRRTRLSAPRSKALTKPPTADQLFASRKNTSTRDPRRQRDHLDRRSASSPVSRRARRARADLARLGISRQLGLADAYRAIYYAPKSAARRTPSAPFCSTRTARRRQACVRTALALDPGRRGR